MDHELRPLSCLRSAGRSPSSASRRRCSCSTSPSSTRRCRTSPTTSTPASAACSGSSTPTRSRSPRSCSPPARSPTASAAGACSPSASPLFTAASLRARPRRHRRASTPPAPCRASARRSCSPSRSRCSPTPSRSAKERAGALAAYGATIGASFAVGPLVGGALTSGLGLALDLPASTSRSGILPVDHRAYRRSGVARPATPAGRLGRPDRRSTGGLFLLVLALLRGNDDGWGSTAIVAELVGAAVAAGRASS